MLVIADASPLHYLILLASTDILPVLFGRIVIPRAVAHGVAAPADPRCGAGLDGHAIPLWLDIQGRGHSPGCQPGHTSIAGEQDSNHVSPSHCMPICS